MYNIPLLTELEKLADRLSYKHFAALRLSLKQLPAPGF
jgi:hypothetical protein